MTEFQKISLIDALNESGESAVCEVLSSFSSPKNKDIEFFLKNTAVQFAKQNRSPTTLIYAYTKNEWKLCGYFTLTIKTIDVEKGHVSSDLFKKLRKFGMYDTATNKISIPVPLIAQLGKNFTDGCDKLIKGDELLKLACDEVRKAQYIPGGKAVYLECENTSNLIKFYEENGFREFARRHTDEDEKKTLKAKHLVQMIKYFR